MTDTWTIDASDGELLVHTDVAGRASKMGHRLTIAMRRWQARVSWSDGVPASAQLRVDVDSLDVLGGDGGLTPLSGPEKILVRSNALRQLGAGRYPEIRFDADSIDHSNDVYRLSGTLRIHGKTRPHVIDLRTEDLGDVWRLSTEAVVRQSGFGVKPYSLLMGSLKVADDVTVSFTAQHEKE
ncbi:MAG TPA: YceI family protein [Mycobacterium sp.]